MIFWNWEGGSRAVWNLSKNQSLLETPPVPYSTQLQVKPSICLAFCSFVLCFLLSCVVFCVSRCCHTAARPFVFRSVVSKCYHIVARHCNHSAFQEENPQARSSRCAPAEPRHRCRIVFWRSDRRQKKDINIFSWQWGVIKIKSNSSTTEIYLNHAMQELALVRTELSISNPPKLLSCQEIKTKMHFLWARDGLQLEVGVLEGF